MAKGGIILDIGTNYNGEGLNKLKQGMTQAGQHAKSASKALGSISQAMGEVQGQTGKTIGAVGNLVQSFMSMGVVGVAITGIGAAFNFVIDQVKAFEQKALDSADKVSEKFKTLFDGITNKASSIKSSFGDIAENISIKNTINSLKGDIESQKKVSEISAKGIKERKTMSNDYDIAFSKAKQQHDISYTVADSQLRKVQENYNLAVERTNAKKQTLNQLRETQSIAKNNASISYRDFGFSFIDNMKGLTSGQRLIKKSDFISGSLDENIKKKIDESFKGNKETLKKVNAEIENAEKELVSLQNKENEAKQKLTIAELQHATALKDADETLSEATKARQKAIDEQKKESDKRIESEKKLSEKLKKSADEKLKKSADEQKKKDEKIEKDSLKKTIEEKQKEDGEIAKQNKEELEKLDNQIAELTNALANIPKNQGGEKGNGDEVKNPFAKQDNQADAQQQKLQRNAEQLANRLFDAKGNLRKGGNAQNLNQLLGMVNDGAELSDAQIEGLKKKRDELRTKSGYTNNKMTKQEKETLEKLNWDLRGFDKQKQLKNIEEDKRKREVEMAQESKQRTLDIKTIKDRIEQMGT